MISLACSRNIFSSVASPYVGMSERSSPSTISMITEKRWPYPGYAWCGDWVTFVLMTMGSLDTCLNRVAVNGQWRIGQNTAMILAAAKARGGIRAPGETWQQGDIWVGSRPHGDHIGFIYGPGNSVDRFESLCGNTYPGGAINRVARAEKPLVVVNLACISCGRPDGAGDDLTAFLDGARKDGFDI